MLTQLKRSLADSPAGPVYRQLKESLWNPLRLKNRLMGADMLDWLGIKHSIEIPLTAQWERVLRRSRGGEFPDLAEHADKVLFVTGYGFSPTILAVESILAMSLHLRGVRVASLLCDRTLPACEFNRFGNWEPDPGPFGSNTPVTSHLSTCNRCTQAIVDTYGPLDVLSLHRLSQYLRSDDLTRLQAIVDSVPYESYGEFVHNRILVGEQAHASVLRSLLRGTLQDDAHTRWLYRRYLLSALLMAELSGRALEDIRPDRVVEIHGVYVTHGTMLEVVRAYGIPVVVYNVPYRRETVLLSHHDTYHRTLVSEPNTNWEHLELTPEQERRLDVYLDSKRSGGRDYITYHPSPVEDQAVIMQELGLDPSRPIIGLFTNVIWDAQIYYNFSAFDNILDWLFQTILYFARHRDLQLVIRVHPAEVKGGVPTNQPILNEVYGRFPSLPENVKVIPPESNLSSYTLVEIIQAALIYGTKMGLEIAVRGVPVVVAGETFNRGKGFTYDVSSKEEYFALLDKVETLPRNSAEVIARARKFGYHLFFRRMMDFPKLQVKDPHTSIGLRIGFDHLSELCPGQDRSLDAICDGILHGSDFVVD